MVTKQREFQKRDALLEPYRSLHARIFKGASDRKVRSVLFTANHRREGCSTVASNLAIYLTRIEQARVLLLELDVLFPAYKPVIPAPRAVGVTDVLAGAADLRAAIHEAVDARLFVLSAGTLHDDLLGLMNERALGDLVGKLKGEFDYVVADGPVVGGLPPVAPIAPHFDGVALVTQANRTRRQVASRSIEGLKAGGNFLGVVLTQRRFFIPDWIYSRL